MALKGRTDVWCVASQSCFFVQAKAQSDDQRESRFVLNPNIITCDFLAK